MKVPELMPLMREAPRAGAVIRVGKSMGGNA